MKKILVLLLSVVVAAGAFAEGQTEMAADEPLTITYMTEHCKGWPETVTPLLEQINAQLGVNWEHIPCGSGRDGIGYREKLRVLFGANQLPDVYETYWEEQIIQQGNSDLSVEEVQEHMPMYYKAISNFAEERGIDLPFTLDRYKRDGILKHYPMVWSSANWAYGYLWRKDYLDELGMDVPVTMEDWEAVFAAYKAAHPDRYSYGTRYRETEYYRAFTAVTNAYGLALSRFIKRGDKLVYSRSQPEMIDVLTILQRWYANGYLDPEFVTKNGESEPFDQGVAIMRGFAHPNWPLDHPNFMKTTKEANPGAEFVLTGPPKVDGHFPVARAWHPMHGNGHGIARRNNDDRDRVHAIMEAADALLETDNAFLIGWGVEGTHWTLGDDGKPQWTEAFAEGESRQGLGLGVLGRSTPIAFGFSQWFGAGDASWGSDPTILEYVQEVRFNPDGVLGPNNLCVNVTSFVGAIDENGDDLRAASQELLHESVAVFGAIITGQQPVSAYQDWIDRYNAGPGPAIEAAATNAWGPVVKECPAG